MVGVESAVRPAFSGCQCTPDPAALSARHVRALRLRIRRCWSTASWQLGVYGSESTHHIESLARWVPAPARAMRAGGVREGRRGGLVELNPLSAGGSGEGDSPPS